MPHGSIGKICASCWAMGAFAVAIIAGLAADNPANVILLRATLAMFACYVIGAIAGLVAEYAIEDGLATYSPTLKSADGQAPVQANPSQDEDVILV